MDISGDDVINIGLPLFFIIFGAYAFFRAIKDKKVTGSLGFYISKEEQPVAYRFYLAMAVGFFIWGIYMVFLFN